MRKCYHGLQVLFGQRPNSAIDPPGKRYASAALFARAFILLFVLGISINVMAQSRQQSAYPANAYLLPVSAKLSLQTALDTYKVVRLQAGDYATGGLAAITLKSGYQLYGFPTGTTIPPVTVEGGTTNAILSSVSTSVTFPASSLITRNCLFQRINGSVTVSDATLEDNLFLDLSYTKVDIDTSTGGYLHNNRFIRTMVHSTFPQLTVCGDTGRQSYGNVFLWFNGLTSHGDVIYIDNQQDIALSSIDAESWDWDATSTKALLTTGTMGVLRAFNVSGGTALTGRTGVFDIAADEFQLYNDYLDPDSSLSDNLIHRYQNTRSLLNNINNPKSTVDEASGAFRANSFMGSATDFVVNGVVYTSPLPANHQTTLRNMVVNPTRTGRPWERPVYDAIPDPGGPNWNVDLASKPDSTAYLQSLIDANGIAQVPAGTYYIASSLHLNNGQGLIGAGEDKTLIVAKNSNIDMIVGNEHYNSGTTMTKLVLTDLTLQGGKNGIHHEPTGSGTSADYNMVYLSHVTFRNMSEAGIHIDTIYAWDNNFVDNLNFVSCAYGFKQRPDPNYQGGDAPGMCFMDKTVFYQCQFVNCGVGVDLPTKREDNLNAWVNCLFSGCTTAAARLTYNRAATFANCDFINNAGNPAVQQTNGSQRYTANFLNCAFRADALGQAMLGGYTAADGCTFERGSSTTATIVTGAQKNHFTNCTAVTMPMGTLSYGTLLNNHFALNSSFDQQGVIVRNGTAYTVLPGTPAPQAQILFGTTFPTVFGNANFTQDFETTTSGSFVRVPSSGNGQSPSSVPPDSNSGYVGRINGLNTTGLSYNLTGLNAGDRVNISTLANNDNTSGDSRGFVMTTFIYRSDNSCSRRFDVTTSALRQWQQLQQAFTIQPGEVRLVTNLSTGFNQSLAFADNIIIRVTPPVSPSILYQGFETGTCGSFTQVASSGNTLSPSIPPADTTSAYVGRIDGLNATAYAFTQENLNVGDRILISMQANNDNTSGDPRGVRIRTYLYHSDGSVSRRLDTPTYTMRQWELLQQPITVETGEVRFTSNFETSFDQSKGFVDDLLITLQPAP